MSELSEYMRAADEGNRAASAGDRRREEQDVHARRVVRQFVDRMRENNVGTIALYQYSSHPIPQPPRPWWKPLAPPPGPSRETRHEYDLAGRGWFVKQHDTKGLIVLDTADLVTCSPEVSEIPPRSHPDLEVPFVTVYGQSVEEATVKWFPPRILGCIGNAAIQLAPDR
jgi:hypothetical protein